MEDKLNLPEIRRSNNEELQSCIRSLATWTWSSDQTPSVGLEKLKWAQSYHALQLQPAEPKAYAVIIDKLMEFAQAFGIRGQDHLKQIAKFYREGLSDLPEDLLASAVNRIILTYKWGHRFPTPADIRETIDSELSERQHIQWKINKAIERIEYGKDSIPK